MRRFFVAQRRSLKARGLHVIQCSAAGAFDLELGELTHPGEQSFALPTPAIFQHHDASWLVPNPFCG
jgi:hypothetical protein